jgi:hypothetical protein
MAVFPHGEDQPRERQALRAIQAGLALSLVARQFREWVHAEFPHHGLPEFAIGVGIHTGEVTLCEVGAPGQQNFTALGDTVNIASRLEGQTKELGWPVVASGAAISAAGDAVVHGAHRVVHLRGRTKPVLVYQILGLKGLAAPAASADDLSHQLREALAGNAEGAALAAKAALRDTLVALLTDAQAPSRSAPMRIKNYAVVAKLGQWRASALYLAERDADGNKVSVRIRQSLGEADPAFQRFVERAPLLGRIRHPHLAPIFDHGFADDVAYIVTEYFPRGTLKQALGLPVSPAVALGALRQAAAALVEVHRLCALAEDIRPENMMVRENGDIALVELDCLGDMGAADERLLAPDRAHYRAPERLAGAAGDQRADLYSLGVIFYEMLTGEPPLTAPAPRLGGELARFQDLLDHLLAKDPAHRYADTAAALHAIEQMSR